MRLLSFRIGDYATFGAVKELGVVDIGRSFGGRTLKQVLRAGELARALEIAAGREPDCMLDQIRYLPTVTDPEKIICIGINYRDRNEEYKDGAEAPRHPSVFMRTPNSLVGHEESILRPPESEQLDYEGEIVLVIGKEGRRIAESDAWTHVAGLTLMNEGSVRDWLRHSKFNVTPGKNFERSGSLGPWMVTGDEVSGCDRLHLTTHVNGELRQDDTTANLMFPFTRLIAYVSSFMPLKPGDLIATGTPAGVGPLAAGDIVEVEIAGVSRVSNPVTNEPRTAP